MNSRLMKFYTLVATTLLLLALPFGISSSAARPSFQSSGAGVTVAVPGTSDPWLAGMPNGSTASCDLQMCDVAPQQSPIEVLGLNLQPGSMLTFSATGMAGYGPTAIYQAGPDGIASMPIQHANFRGYVPENGIANLLAPTDALVGVFLGQGRPDASPLPPDLAGPTATPLLKQVFLIGSSRSITVPEGATRLFLGIMDGFGWWDNSGSFTVSIKAEGCQVANCPKIKVEPSNVSFSGLRGNERRISKTIVITNDGSIGSMLTGTIVSPDSPFSLRGGDTGGFTLQQGERRSIIVVFEPPAATGETYESMVRIRSDDPTTPTVTIPVTGKGIIFDKHSPAKGQYGHFYYRDLIGDDIEIDPEWVEENTRLVFLPGCGTQRVNNNAVASFVEAFGRIGSDPFLLGQIRQCDGVFSPRYQRSRQGQPPLPREPRYLSSHSWGITVDINSSTNEQGHPGLDPNCQFPGCLGIPSTENINLWQLAFRPSGFFWGVDFKNLSRSDPMHFELRPQTDH
jgi:hypothetical protein